MTKKSQFAVIKSGSCSLDFDEERLVQMIIAAGPKSGLYPLDIADDILREDALVRGKGGPKTYPTTESRKKILPCLSERSHRLAFSFEPTFDDFFDEEMLAQSIKAITTQEEWTALHLVFFQSYQCGEAAQEMGLEKKSFKLLLRSAIGKLREKLLQATVAVSLH